MSIEPRRVPQPVRVTEEQLETAAHRVVDLVVEQAKRLLCTCDRECANNKTYWLCLVHGWMKI